MHPTQTIEQHAIEAIRKFGDRTDEICSEIAAYHSGDKGNLSAEAQELLDMLTRLCASCYETRTAHDEHVLVEFDQAQPKTESTTEQRPMSNGIQRFFHWVAKHPEIIVGTVTFSIGLAFFLVIRKDK